MKIAQENLAAGHLLLRVAVAEADYKTVVEKALKEYRRKANVPGFRPGMVPMGMINKMYGKGVLAEETYRLASKEAFDYIEKEKIEMLGDLIPSTRQADLDFDKGGDFEFAFEVGVAPEVNIDLDKAAVTRYAIEPDAAMVKNYRDNFLRRFGRLEDAEVVTKEEALAVTLDNEQMNVEDAYVGLISMSDKARKPFIGKKAGDVLKKVNIEELYPTPSQRASILQVKEEELAGINPEFTLTITKIRKFVEPEMNGEFFKTAFPGGEVASAEGFDTFVLEQIGKDLNREAEYVYTFTVRKMLLEKAALGMPEEFLRQWLFTINEGKFTMEQIGEEFPQFVDMMRWNLIQKHYADKLSVKVEPDDAVGEAREYAAMQFAQYGMGNVADEMLTNYAQQILKNKDEARKIYDRLFEKKIIEAVSGLLKVTDKCVSPEEFTKVAEKL